MCRLRLATTVFVLWALMVSMGAVGPQSNSDSNSAAGRDTVHSADVGTFVGYTTSQVSGHALSNGTTALTTAPVGQWSQRTYGEWAKSKFQQTQLSSSAWVHADAGEFDDVGREIKALVAFDADGDGDTDLAVGANLANALYLNGGAGGFIQAEAGDFDDESNAFYALAAFDADGDGDIDLAVGHTGKGLYLNDGSGRFTRVNAGDFGAPGAEITTFALAAFDADGDGDIDLAAGHYDPDKPNAFYLNDGTGRYTRTDAGEFDDTAHKTNALAAFDADADGDIDLAEGIEGRNRLYLNDGTGRFSQVEAGAFGNEDSYTKALVAFDADGDGDLDLAVGSDDYVGTSASSNRLYLNDGTGVFEPWSSASSVAFNDTGNQYTRALAAFDADGDGDMDMAVGNEASLELYLNDGTGYYRKVDAGEFDDQLNETPLVAFDANGDGAVDLAVKVLFGPVVLFLNNGHGAFTRLATAGELGEVSPGTYDLAAFDANGDGYQDLAVGNWKAKALYFGDGSGRFTRVDAGDFSANDERTARALAAFDADGDGDTDLAVGNGTYRDPEQNALYMNDGTGVFTEADAGDFDDTAEKTYVLAAFDADGDGDIDLAVGNDGEHSAPNALYLNDGSGNYTKIDAGHFDDRGDLQALVAFDADGDGDIDLARGGYVDTTVPLYLNDGSAHYTQVNAGDFNGLGLDLAAYDADGDGDLDLAAAVYSEFTSYPFRAYLNDGAGLFTEVRVGGPSSTERHVRALAAFDADGDGDIDIAVGKIYGERNVLYLNNGAGIYHQVDAGEFDDEQQDTYTLAALDADNDGDLDLAVGNYGQNALYLNRNLYEVGTVTSPIIVPAYSHPADSTLQAWQELVVAGESVPEHTSLTYDVLDPATGELIPGYQGLRPDASGRISLSGLDVHSYSAIQVRANFADLDAGPDTNDQTPRLCEWTVTYQMGPGPRVIKYFPLVLAS